MKNAVVPHLLAVAVLSLFMVTGGAVQTYAHCDTLDGPVVKAARKALETGNVKLVLIWVQKEDEADIDKAFRKTLTVRKQGPEAKELADMYFFETLVRLHRAGEGAPYTGLKSSGANLGPVVPAADRAIETGSPNSLLGLLTEAVQKGGLERYKQVMDRKNYDPGNVNAGREYVKSYVEFVHYVEGIHVAAEAPGDLHAHEPDASAGHKE